MTVVEMTTATERLPLLPDVERIFAAFVRNANSVADHAKTVRGDEYRDRGMLESSSRKALAAILPIESSDEIPILLEAPRLERPAIMEDAATVPRLREAPSTQDDASTTDDTATVEEESAAPDVPVRHNQTLQGVGIPKISSEMRWEEFVAAALGEDATPSQEREAEAVVPDVRSIAPPAPPVRERAEDGQIPARELERAMTDMAVLLRYGHDGEVGERLDDLYARYPQDLLLLRRIAEFHLETGSKDLAVECLFKLASALFERRNYTGMRASLEQVLVLRPADPRAVKLLDLLEHR